GEVQAEGKPATCVEGADEGIVAPAHEPAAAGKLAGRAAAIAPLHLRIVELSEVVGCPVCEVEPVEDDAGAPGPVLAVVENAEASVRADPRVVLAAEGPLRRIADDPK